MSTVRLIRLNEWFPLFMGELDDWFGYGGHISINSAKYDTVMLPLQGFPDIQFHCIMESSYSKHLHNGEWQVYLAADLTKLKADGLIYQIGEESAILGASEFDALHLFQDDVLSVLRRLTLVVDCLHSEPTIGEPEGLNDGEIEYRTFYRKVSAGWESGIQTTHPEDELHIRSMRGKFSFDDAFIKELVRQRKQNRRS